MHPGLPCSESGLRSSNLGACAALGTSCSTFSSFEISPPMMGPTCDDDVFYLNKRFDSRFNLNLFHLSPTTGFYIFLR
jgi:hypothetical protein